VWTGSIGAGLALTQGNTATTNTNVSFDVKRDAQTKTVFKAQGLYIRATQDGNDNVDRALVSGRVEYKLTPRAYTFGQLQDVRASRRSTTSSRRRSASGTSSSRAGG